MFDLTPEEARLLLKVALMATGRNRFVSAAKILAVLERFRPDQASVAVAKALALISAQEFQMAVDYIDAEGLARFPSSGMLLTFKGMALMRMNRMKEAREPLEAATRSEDEAAVQMAADLLKDVNG